MPAIDPPAPPRAVRPRFDDATIARLDALLMQGCLQHNGLSLEAVDGLFSCAFVSPGAPFTLAEFLPLVMGERDEPAPEELVQLLELMWNVTGPRIERTAVQSGDAGLPLIGVPPFLEEPEACDGVELVDFPAGSAWALGFMLCFCMREDEWDARLNEDEELAYAVGDIFSLISSLFDDEDEDGDGDAVDSDVLSLDGEEGEASDPDTPNGQRLDDGADLFPWDDGPDEEPPSFEDRLDIIRLLPEILHQLHTVALEERQPDMSPDSDQSPPNDELCPCGSGRAFKKCHGDPSRLN